MKKKIIIFLLLLLLVISCKKSEVKKTEPEKNNDQELIKTTIANYINSLETKDVSRITNFLNEKYILRYVTNKKFKTYNYNDFNSIINNNDNINQPDIKLYGINKNIATASIISENNKRYIHLAKIKDSWQIINETTEKNSTQNITDIDKEKIKQAGLDYVEGFFSSKERIKKALHTDLAKRTPNMSSIDNVNFEQMVVFAKDKELSDTIKVDVDIFDINDNIATINVKSNFIDYCHLIKENGEWKIINVLWNYK